ncbi:HD domain-containing protein [Nanoarchaeota archaeon]
MEINDIVYGKYEIDDPVLIDIINSKPLQRLKGIYQAGASRYVFNKNITRFEHSVGVMILLKIMGASIEEQIAGLIHDIPHTAFSHTIDFVFKNENHDYHEQFHEKLILNSEIPEILIKHGYDVKYFLDEKNFPLLEKSIPDLCADRIDYTLRDAFELLENKENIKEYVKEYIDNLMIYNNEFIFKNKEIAKKFAEDYLKFDDLSWANPIDVAIYQVMADAIKIALNENILNQDDIFSDDDFVYDKLKNSNNKSILEKLNMLNKNFKVKVDKNDPDIIGKSKLRNIDPKSYNNGDVKRASEFYPDYKEKLEEHNKKVLEGYHIKIIK